MKKVNRVFNTISISILVLALIGVSGTYLSDCLNEIGWFGDKITEHKHTYFSGSSYIEWGARHYWYYWGVFLLFCTALGRAIANVVMIIEEK